MMWVMKKIDIANNTNGGVDLITERDSGNDVKILTGNHIRSLDFWNRMKAISEEAIDRIYSKQSK